MTRAGPFALLLWGLATALPAAAEPPPVSSGPPSSRGAAPFGFQEWNNDAPLSINAEEMEAVQRSGARTLVFRKQVQVHQGDLSVRCRELEAIYPPDANQPDRLVARGAVQVAQGRQTASCDQMTYDRAGDRLSCRGNARFRDGDNEVAGDLIEIDLARESVRVTGGASLVIQPDTLEGVGAP